MTLPRASTYVRCLAWRSATAAILLATATSALKSQSPADRKELERSWEQLHHTVDESRLITNRERATERLAQSHHRALALTEYGLASLAVGLGAETREPLDAAQAAFDEAIHRAPKDWPWPWYGLALTDLALDSAGYTVKASMHQPAGMYYHDAGIRALGKALQSDPLFTPAASRLARVLLPFEHFDFDTETEAAIRLAASMGTEPTAWLILGRIFWNRASPDSAAEAFERYVMAEGDSGIGLLELARAQSGVGDSTAALKTYFAGASTNSPLARSAYRQDIAWVASPSELAAFDSLQVAGKRGRWIRDFWAKRDADDFRPPGGRLLEHLRRWRYVFQHFQLTSRRGGTSKAGGANCGPGSIPSLRDDPALQSSPDLQLLSPGTFAATQRGQRVIDDRGLIYMRYGEPDQRASASIERTINSGLTPVQTETRPNESWLYATPNGRLIFHFCGSLSLGTQAPTTLVEMLPLNPEMIGSRSGLDPRFAALEGEIRTGRIANAATSSSARNLIEQLAADARRDLAIGLTTDGYPPRFKHQLEPEAQFYAVGSPGQALVVFALPGDKLRGQTLPDGGTGYSLVLRVIATNAAGEIARIDTTRRFRAGAPLEQGQYLFGLEQLKLSPGTWNVRLLVTQPGVDAGGAIGRLGVAVPSDAGLALSDLVLGREGSGLIWQSPAGQVPLNPLDLFPPEGSAELYYELHGATPDRTYQTDIEVKGVYGNAKGTVHLGFSEKASDVLVRARRSIGLDKLEQGQYRITVTVTEEGTGKTAVRSRLLTIGR